MLLESIQSWMVVKLEIQVEPGPSGLLQATMIKVKENSMIDFICNGNFRILVVSIDD